MARAYPSFCSMKQLRVQSATPPTGGMLVHHSYPQQYVAGTHLYTWVEGDNVGVKCLV